MFLSEKIPLLLLKHKFRDLSREFWKIRGKGIMTVGIRGERGFAGIFLD